MASSTKRPRTFDALHQPFTTRFETFRRNPALFLAYYIYRHQPPIIPAPHLQKPTVRIVCISDTHNTQPVVPDGDILLHAGDLSNNCTFSELQEQIDWLRTLPHAHKVVIPGNHDLLLDPAFLGHSSIESKAGERASDLEWGNMKLLIDSSIAIRVKGRAINIFGAPRTRGFGPWAFQYRPRVDIWKNLVPQDTNILLTHGPSKGHLDAKMLGCHFMNQELWRTKPQLVVFGHIHEGRGQEIISWDAVQWVYDGVVSGSMGICYITIMVVAWLWAWFTFLTLGSKRQGRTELVNAAVLTGIGRQEEGIVVDI